MSEKDTTHEGEGVSEDNSLDTEQKQETFIDRRNVDLEAIAANRKKDFEEESGVKLDEEEQEEEKPAETDEEKKPEENEDDFIEIQTKVDGEIKTERIPKADLTALWQKKTATEKRFTEVSTLKAKLEKDAREKNLKELDEKESEKPSEQDASKHKAEDKDAEDPVEKALNDPKVAEARQKRDDAILYGEEDEVKTASLEYDKALLKAIYAATQSGAGRQESSEETTIDENKLDVAIARREINRSFEKDFKDLKKDSDFWGFFRMKVSKRVDQKLEEGADAYSYDTYKEAGEEVRKELGISSESEEKKVLNLSERQDRKKKLTSVDSASAKTETSKSKEDKPQSPSEVVKAIAQARPGQHNY